MFLAGWLAEVGCWIDFLIFDPRSSTEIIPDISYLFLIPIQEHDIMVAYTWIPSDGVTLNNFQCFF